MFKLWLPAEMLLGQREVQEAICPLVATTKHFLLCLAVGLEYTDPDPLGKLVLVLLHEAI